MASPSDPRLGVHRVVDLAAWGAVLQEEAHSCLRGFHGVHHAHVRRHFRVQGGSCAVRSSAGGGSRITSRLEVKWRSHRLLTDNEPL